MKQAIATPRTFSRVHYGYAPDGEPLYWNVRVMQPRKSVVIKSTMQDAVNGLPGSTVGCHLSICAVRNAAAFPHPCILAAFTHSTVMIVSRFANGSAVEAYAYRHDASDLVELDDKEPDKRTIKAHPELVERDILLRPRQLRTARKGVRPTGKRTGEHRPSVPRGALRRAIDAGLISPGVLMNGVTDEPPKRSRKRKA